MSTLTLEENKFECRTVYRQEFLNVVIYYMLLLSKQDVKVFRCSDRSEYVEVRSVFLIYPHEEVHAMYVSDARNDCTFAYIIRDRRL